LPGRDEMAEDRLGKRVGREVRIMERGQHKLAQYLFTGLLVRCDSRQRISGFYRHERRRLSIARQQKK